MKMYLISDNVDTYTGIGLAEGVCLYGLIISFMILGNL